MIGGCCPGKLTNVKVLNGLKMLSSGNSADKNDDMAYIAEVIFAIL